LAACGRCDREALTTLLSEDFPLDFGNTIASPPTGKPAVSRIATRPG